MSEQNIEHILTPADQIHGKLFPLWALRAFKGLIMGKDSMQPGVDQCKALPTAAKALRPYQVFLSKYMARDMPFQGLLVYHGLGTGKTAGAVHLINVLDKGRYNVFILLPAALKDSWKKDIQTWSTDPTQHDLNFISTNASNFADQFFDAVKKADSTKRSLFIIDEAHKFVGGVRSNILAKRQRALSVYNHIQNEVLTSPDTKVVLLSGTPIRSDPYECGLLFNLLRPGCLPDTEASFKNIFVEADDGVPRLRPSRKHLFQRRILGLVSYFKGSSPALFAREEVSFIDLVMTGTQDQVYSAVAQEERKAEALAARKGSHSTRSFKTASRQASNFALHTKRPRPSQYRLSEKDAATLSMGKAVEEDTNKSVVTYLKACKQYMREAEAHLSNIRRNDKGGLENDLKEFRKGRISFQEFCKGPRSTTFKEMYSCSAKLTAALFLVALSPGQAMLYSNFVLVEGLEAFAMYLRLLGGIPYVEYHGSVPAEMRQQNLEKYNRGEARVVLLSSAGAEGISLKNVRTVVVLEPAWSEDTIQQVIGRAIRQCSHKDLPMEERVVQIHRLKAVQEDGKPTTDLRVEEEALRKHALKQSFLDAMREAAVDCDIFSAQNDMEGSCFRFPADMTTKPKPGPAYLKDIEDDLEEEGFQIARIKVRKISAVPRHDLSSEPISCLLDESSGAVYSNRFHVPLGTVKKDAKGFFDQLEVGVYVLDSTYLV